MNKGSVILAAAFLGIISLLSLSVYSGIIEIKKPQNLLGLIGNDSDGFKFVGSVDLENSSSTKDNYFSSGNKKEASAPIKIKKSKEPSQTIVKVISGVAVNKKDIVELPLVMVSSTILNVSSTIATTSSVKALAQILEKIPEKIQEKIPEKIVEQVSEQAPDKILEQTPEQIPKENIEQNNTSPVQENISGNILVSEIMVGMEGNLDYEFIELYNPTANSIDLTGYSIRKRNSKNNEESLVSTSHFKDKVIPPNKYFLLANEGGYDGQISADVFWPKSYTLAYTSNTIIIYNSKGELVEEVGWTEISKGQSIERESFGGNQFKTQTNPNPQNSLSN